MNWKFWKSNGRKSKTREWIDALVFAVVAATIIRTFLIEAFTIPTPSMEKSLLVGDFLFVSKVSYGARTPMTPLSFPFVHQELPLIGGKSYSDAVKWGYHRLPGFGNIKNNDVVVFNYPGNIFYPDDDLKRPIDKKTHYIKRCVGIPGDSLKIIDGLLFVNNKPVQLPEHGQMTYTVITDGNNSTYRTNILHVRTVKNVFAGTYGVTYIARGYGIQLIHTGPSFWSVAETDNTAVKILTA